MNETPSIRPAGREDAAGLHGAIADLARLLGDAENFRARPEDYRRHGFGPSALFRALIAEDEDESGATRICGAVTYFPEFSTYRGVPGVYVQDLWVAESRRGSGLGRRLLGAVVREASTWQAAYLKLSTHATNPRAIAFYERLGFESNRNEMSFLIEGQAFAGLQGVP